jgi:hypothetical protein
MRQVYDETWDQSHARYCLKLRTQFAIYVTTEAFIFRNYIKQNTIIIINILFMG